MPTTFKVAPDPALVNVEPSLEELLRLVVAAAEDKKADQPVALDLTELVDYVDYLVICSGQTDVQNRAIADNVIEALGRYGIMPEGVSGYSGGQWILLDYGVLIVHVFLPRLREYYRLEELWGGGKEIRFAAAA
jgi:ribosome-associated protein